jgi:hypothetical protein
LTRQKHGRFERTELLCGIEKNANAIMDFINNSNYRYDVYADSKGPSLVIKIEAIRKSYIEFVRRGGRIRFITEVTRENLNYCKDIMKLVELRHIEGIKGIVRINEKEYQSNLAVQESKLTSILFRSTLREVVQVQQHVYDKLWKTAIPAEQRIRELEIEEGAEYSVNKKSYQVLQLWTNQDHNQYAIRFEGKSDFLAATDRNAQYTDLVEQSEYFEDLKYNWDYTLKYWISRITHTLSFASSIDGSLDTQLIADKKTVNKKGIPSRKSGSKCNFCKLEFGNNKNRREHERMWHTTNTGSSISNLHA